MRKTLVLAALFASSLPAQKLTVWTWPPIPIPIPSTPLRERIQTSDIANMPTVTLPNPALVGKTMVLTFTPAPNTVVEATWRDSGGNVVGVLKKETGATTNNDTRTLDLVFPASQAAGTVEVVYKTAQ